MRLALSPGEIIEKELLQKRLRSLANAAPMGLLTSLVSIFVLAVTLTDTSNQLFLWIWWFIATSIVILRAIQLHRIDRTSEDIDYLKQVWRRATRTMYASSLGWAISLPYAAMLAQGLELPLVAAVGTGVFISALLMYRSVPRAAQVHIFLLSIAFLITAWILAGIQSLIFGLLVLVYGFTLSRSLNLQDRNFVSSIIHSVERRESESTVRLLLNDYELHTSDWLWTTMPDGTLRDVSPQFGKASARNPDEMEGQPLIDLFMEDPARDRLQYSLTEGKPIRDHVVPLTVRGEQRYWEISAHPRADGRMSGVARDVTSTKLAEERVSRMAHFDGLTGLANRYLFNERLRDALETRASQKSNVALFYLDLDDFKSVNDTQGHLVGDQLLCEVGRRLTGEVRDGDLVARLGGDEFAILVETGAGSAGLIERAHRFLTVMREPYHIGDHVFRISASIGVARRTDEPCDALELLRRADLALYAAKAKGRDSFALFEASLDKAARQRRETELRLREAMEQEQLLLHYQPIIDLSSGETKGYEALVRWQHPERGLLNPVEFVGVAEATGLIVPLGEWIIHQALIETAKWPEHLRIAINLSPTQVGSPRLVKAVAESMAFSGIAPQRVDFEITEHVVLEGSDANKATLHKLRELGACVSLDDFGTGYSSLNYVRNFPFDRLKIDRDFVAELMTSRSSQAIVNTICRLADAMGMDTVAEGVEQIEQLEMLREMGCTEAQGFAIARPQPGRPELAAPAQSARANGAQADGPHGNGAQHNDTAAASLPQISEAARKYCQQRKRAGESVSA